MLSKWEPADLIALLVVCVCGILLGMGRDSIIGVTLVAVVTGYFGIRITPLGDLLKGKKRNRR